MMSKNLKRRKTGSFLINPKFQLGIIAKVCGMALLNIILLVFAVEHSFDHFHEQGLKMNFPLGSFYFSLLEKERERLLWGISIVGVINLIILVIGGLVHSHRVAGPLHRLKMHATDVSEGKTNQDLSFRKKDYFIDVSVAYNRLMAAYRRLKQK